MVKQIIWSENAIQDRLQISDYWFKRTGNKKYSKYLDTCFIETVKIISQFPLIGREYKDIGFRYMIREHYLIFYEVNKDKLSILSIFDSRRNPEIIVEKTK